MTDKKLRMGKRAVGVLLFGLGFFAIWGALQSLTPFFVIVFGFVGAALVFSGVRVWGWTYRRRVIGTYLIVAGGLFGLLVGAWLLLNMLTKSPLAGYEVSIFRNYILACIAFLATGIYFSSTKDG